MRRADLRGADFTGARLIVTDLREADLRRADFTGARLDGTLLDGANLEGANLEGAVLEKPFLRGVKNLTSEQLSKVARAVGIHVFPNQAAIMERAFGQPQPKGEATLIGVAPYVVEKDG
ncbi:MAG: pentapeptide repeat-containing protein [Deltaproteobacteria bacterium]|nr:pentapeptide repeat-containing protein [Deltaproteobacteria bacterium]